jgi:hypothetical protein
MRILTGDNSGRDGLQAEALGERDNWVGFDILYKSIYVVVLGLKCFELESENSVYCSLPAILYIMHGQKANSEYNEI